MPVASTSVTSMLTAPTTGARRPRSRTETLPEKAPTEAVMIADRQDGRDRVSRGVTKRPPYPSGVPAGNAPHGRRRASRPTSPAASAGGSQPGAGARRRRGRDPAARRRATTSASPRIAAELAGVHESRSDAGAARASRPPSRSSATCRAVAGEARIVRATRGSRTCRRARSPGAPRRTSMARSSSSGRMPARPMPVSSSRCDGSGSASPARPRRIRLGLARVVQRRRQAVGALAAASSSRLRARQHEHLAGDPGAAQRHALLGVGDGESVRPLARQPRATAAAPWP